MNSKHESDASKEHKTFDFGILAPFQTQVSRLTRHHTACTLTGCFQQKAVNYAHFGIFSITWIILQVLKYNTEKSPYK